MRTVIIMAGMFFALVCGRTALAHSECDDMMGAGKCPVDVERFMDKLNNCDNLNSIGNKGRAEMDHSQCDRIGCDYQKLIKRYSASPATLRAIKDYAAFYKNPENDHSRWDFALTCSSQKTIKPLPTVVNE